MSHIQDSAITGLPPWNEEIIIEAIKIVHKIRKHIGDDQCICCKEALED